VSLYRLSPGARSSFRILRWRIWVARGAGPELYWDRSHERLYFEYPPSRGRRGFRPQFLSLRQLDLVVSSRQSSWTLANTLRASEQGSAHWQSGFSPEGSGEKPSWCDEMPTGASRQLRDLVYECQGSLKLGLIPQALQVNRGSNRTAGRQRMAWSGLAES